MFGCLPVLSVNFITLDKFFLLLIQTAKMLALYLMLLPCYYAQNNASIMAKAYLHGFWLQLFPRLSNDNDAWI